MKNFRKNQGITLIALVITVIVLLILAGVTIAALSGDNGILQRATEAKDKTEKTNLEEKIKLAILDAQIVENGYNELTTENLGNSLIKDGTKAIVSDNEDGTKHILFLDEKKEYKLDNDGNIEDLNIDFDTKYVAPNSQDEERNNGVIGIGTDGQPVDMDLWEYTLLKEGTYALNSSDVLNNKEAGGTNEEEIVKPGYKGECLYNGEIVGMVPQYISVDKGFNFIEVTNMYATFCTISELKIMPKIPNTVIMLRSTFSRCKNLITLSLIPKNVIDMHGTFYNCSSIKVAPKIPDKVQDCFATFQGCTNLITGTTVPISVLNARYMYADCPNLQGTLEINANINSEHMEDGYTNYLGLLIRSTTADGISLKVYGKCPMLEVIVNEAENPKITL